VRRMQREVVRCGDPAAMRAFARVPGAHVRSLESAILVAEVMGD
jgi:hypothetical protein